jgi:hypothetical protein
MTDGGRSDEMVCDWLSIGISPCLAGVSDGMYSNAFRDSIASTPFTSLSFCDATSYIRSHTDEYMGFDQ